MVVNKKILQSFSNLGLSENEAKAYCALLGNNPATGYEIAKDAMIPSNKIYGILAKLLEKEMIIEIKGNRNKYVPVDPDEFLSKYRSDLKNTLDYLQINLSNIKNSDNISYIWNITDYEYLINKAEHIINNSKKNLLLSIWKQEMELLKIPLQISRKNGSQIATIHFGNPDYKIGQIFHHPIEDTLYNEKGGRCLVMVSDSVELLIGTIYKDGHVDGVYSKNKGFVMIAEDYLKHDIYIMKVVNRFDRQLIKTFGNNYHLLRDVFTDKELT